MRLQQGFAPHVSRMGRGPRPVLALHCTLAFSGAWGGLARAIGDRVTLIAPDMPSHGRSADWDGTSNFADTVFDASLACLTEPMDVIGHSFGAATALRLAVLRPDLVRTVTMIEPVFFCIARLDAPDLLAKHDIQAEAFLDDLAKGEAETAARLFNRVWSDGPRWPDMPEQVRAAMTRAIHVVPDTSAFLYEDTEALVPRLGDIQAPALLVRGENCLPVITAVNAGLARRIPGAEEAVIEGAGHMAPITHAQAFGTVWTDFIARRGSSG